MVVLKERLWCARQCERHSTSTASCNPQVSLVLTGWNRHAYLWQMRRLKLKRGKWFASICVTDKWLSSVQSLSHVRLLATPWTAARQASLSITISRRSLRLASIESMMPSSHLILGRPLLFLPPTPPSIRVFSSESTLHMRCPNYWSFSFSIIPSKEIPGLISFRMDWLDLLAVQGILKSLLQHHQFKSISSLVLSLQSNSHIHTWPLEKP